MVLHGNDSGHQGPFHVTPPIHFTDAMLAMLGTQVDPIKLEVYQGGISVHMCMFFSLPLS